jgi:hypothetical protein
VWEKADSVLVFWGWGLGGGGGGKRKPTRGIPPHPPMRPRLQERTLADSVGEVVLFQAVEVVREALEAAASASAAVGSRSSHAPSMASGGSRAPVPALRHAGSGGDVPAWADSDAAIAAALAGGDGGEVEGEEGEDEGDDHAVPSPSRWSVGWGDGDVRASVAVPHITTGEAMVDRKSTFQVQTGRTRTIQRDLRIPPSCVRICGWGVCCLTREYSQPHAHVWSAPLRMLCVTPQAHVARVKSREEVAAVRQALLSDKKVRECRGCPGWHLTESQPTHPTLLPTFPPCACTL